MRVLRFENEAEDLLHYLKEAACIPGWRARSRTPAATRSSSTLPGLRLGHPQRGRNGVGGGRPVAAPRGAPRPARAGQRALRTLSSAVKSRRWATDLLRRHPTAWSGRRGVLVRSEDRYPEAANDARAREFAVLDLLEADNGGDVAALRAVLRIGQAALGAQRVEDVMEVVAEESLRALDAASFSISRWQRDREVLQTLINVGELGPGEALAGGRGVPAGRLPDRDRPPAPRGALRVRDRRSPGQPRRGGPTAPARQESEIAVPVIYEYVTWGELWGHRQRRPAVRGAGREVAPGDRRAGGAGDRACRAVRARHALRHEDPLTHLANRRLLDERLAGAGSEPDPAGLRRGRSQGGQRPRGHPAGDALLRGVAGALSLTASAFPQSLVAQAGGDEFCVLLPGAQLAAAERLARAASRHIAAELGERVSVCWGAACSASGRRSDRRRRRGAAGGQGTRAWPAAAAAC